MLNREEILKTQDTKYKDVSVPEWNGTVRLKSLSVGERDRFEQKFVSAQKDDVKLLGLRVELVIACAVDEAGETLFNKQDALELSKKNGEAVNRLFMEALALSGMQSGAVAQAKENLEQTPDGASALN